MKVSNLSKLITRLLCTIVLIAPHAINVVTADELPKDNTPVTPGDEIDLPPIYSWYWDTASGRIKTTNRTELWSLQRQNRKINGRKNHRSADKPEERDIVDAKPDITITDGKAHANDSNITLASPPLNKNRLSLAGLGSIYAGQVLTCDFSSSTFGKRPHPKNFRSVGESLTTRQDPRVIRKTRSGDQSVEKNSYEKYPGQNDRPNEFPPKVDFWGTIFNP